MKSEIFGELVFAKRHADDWRGAVDAAGRLWLERGLCEQRYIDMIKTQLSENNAYAVIIPGLVLLHAPAGEGVLENSLMLMTLDEPVEFGHEENDPVEVMICFTAVGKQDHLNSMKRIANMLLDDDFVAKAAAAQTDEELMSAVRAMEAAAR